MLLQIGDADVDVTIGELALRGFNLLSNVSYNVQKMVDYGYLLQNRSKHDRRIIFVRSTRKGRSFCRQLSKMHTRYVNLLHNPAIDEKETEQLAVTLRKLDSFWMTTAEMTARTTMQRGGVLKATARVRS